MEHSYTHIWAHTCVGTWVHGGTDKKTTMMSAHIPGHTQLGTINSTDILHTVKLDIKITIHHTNELNDPVFK